MKREKFSSPLSWRRADFIIRGEEVPDKLLVDTLHTEGELMTKEELDEWVEDTAKTFCIVREVNEKRFEELLGEFTEDLRYLTFLGKITQSEAENLAKSELYTF